LGLDGDVPDHSTFSKNRHGRFRESDLLRKLFQTVVGRCMKERIVGGDAFAVDASIIVADAPRRQKLVSIKLTGYRSSRGRPESLYLLDVTMPALLLWVGLDGKSDAPAWRPSGQSPPG
jgi:hypothetical protein